MDLKEMLRERMLDAHLRQPDGAGRNMPAQADDFQSDLAEHTRLTGGSSLDPGAANEALIVNDHNVQQGGVNTLDPLAHVYPSHGLKV